ncbi:unnamed protein product [Cunninghamella blakesleeana]
MLILKIQHIKVSFLRSLSNQYSTIPYPSKQLNKLYEISKEVNQTKSIKQKQLIVKQYPECQPILKRIYDPHRRLFVSSKTVLSYMDCQLKNDNSNNNTNNNSGLQSLLPPTSNKNIDSLEALLDALSSRQISGHAALDTISNFYQRYCTTKIQQQMFWKIIDRNLKIGISTKSIHLILSENKKHNDDQHIDINVGDCSNSNINTTDKRKVKKNNKLHQEPYDRRFMKVSLAATMNSKDENRIFNEIKQQQQKKNGVRCLTLIQPLHDPPIIFCSRTGRTFDSLHKVENAIQQQLMKHDYWNKSNPSGSIVLDGEICIYQCKDDIILPLQSNIPNNNNNSDDRGEVKSDIDAIKDNKREDFLETLRQIRKSTCQMEHPVYEVFDLIDMDVFQQGNGGLSFSQRQQKLYDLLGTNTNEHLNILEQTPLVSKNQLLKMQQKVAKYNWEGLIIRKNVTYEGRRSSNMLKIKEWEDAEYVVNDIETSWMRMPDTGEEKQVMKNAIIKHKGNTVYVGSGFSLSERIKYANHPDLIIGKLITVKYFSESLGESGVASLRFPTVKAIYENGRD